MKQIDMLIEKYSKIGDNSKVSVLNELLHKMSFYGINTAILKLKAEYTRFGDLSKISVLDELDELL